MSSLQSHHDMSDTQGGKWEPIIKQTLGKHGGSYAHDTRVFIHGVCWILRTDSPWRDLPRSYGKFGSVHRRFKRWCDKGIWDSIFDQLIEDPDFEWLIIDAFHCKGHLHGTGAIGGNQEEERTKGG